MEVVVNYCTTLKGFKYDTFFLKEEPNVLPYLLTKNTMEISLG